MADTQFIKRTIEPYMRRWLEAQFPGSVFMERPVQLRDGSFKFDAVSANEAVVAHFLCGRPQTSTGNENTGARRKALNDLQQLRLLPSSSVRLLVFTDDGFRELIRKRGKRIGLDGIDLLRCHLPDDLQRQLHETLDACSGEQRSRTTGQNPAGAA